MTRLVVIALEDKVQHVRLNRPEKKNALTNSMYHAMAEALERADQDPRIRVTTITGTGDAFTSGNDLAEFLQPASAGESPVRRFLAAISQATKPVLAAVNSLSVGIGVTMLLHCDLVYAAETALFQMPFVNLGLVPEAASSLLLPRLAGRQRATQLLLLGERFDAAAAKEIGLINKVCSSDSLEAEMRTAAAILVDKPPAAVRLTKALIKGDISEVSNRMSEEQRAFGQQLQSAEAREAMQAFLEKRRPDFSRFA